MTNIKVPFIDLKQRFVEEREELLACVERVLSKGHFILTQEVTDFERHITEFTAAKHCIALNSGTDALMLGLMAMGIGKGDEVITAPNSFVASAGSIAHIGATPTFADVSIDQNINPVEIERRITPRTKAIMPVHWTGRIADMHAIQAIADKHGLMIIEDSAQSMGAYYHGKHGGTFGRVGCFSAHPLKNFNAVGDGGFMVTNDDEIAKHCRIYRNHGLLDRNTCVMFGVNSRLDSLHAEILSFRLTRLESVVERRRKNADIYRSLIKAPEVYMPQCKPHEKNAFVMFIVQCDRRDQLKAFLQERGIESLVYYPTPIHLQPAAAKLGYKRGDFPVAERQADRVLALPHHQNLTETQIEFVANSVNEFYGVR